METLTMTSERAGAETSGGYDPVDFGARLDALLKERGLTQKAFGRRMGVAQAYVSKWINGEKNPGIEYAVRIAEALDVSMDYLFRGEADAPALTEGQRMLLAAAAEFGPDGVPILMQFVIRHAAELREEVTRGRDNLGPRSGR